ncbi:hypothetical protein P167DRAFT_183064 [Morchella conica CCBAS932]|uniref:Uncharacterized protein n=1 Tax=Morchella conica CCBAS932 TaxID=1392247 RepID=A0A3N4KN50_9PEZI|nr:hypothetical protein P167DRAFT_183064 [Morchella conica CCBAS932]
MISNLHTQLTRDCDPFHPLLVLISFTIITLFLFASLEIVYLTFLKCYRRSFPSSSGSSDRYHTIICHGDQARKEHEGYNIRQWLMNVDNTPPRNDASLEFGCCERCCLELADLCVLCRRRWLDRQI